MEAACGWVLLVSLTRGGGTLFSRLPDKLGEVIAVTHPECPVDAHPQNTLSLGFALQSSNPIPGA